MSESDDDAPSETASLLRTPANTERLLAALERVRAGHFETHDLLEE